MRRIARISGGGISAGGIGPRIPSETYFWDTATGKELPRFGSLQIRCEWLVFSPDGALLATNGDASDLWFHLWDAATGRQLHKLEPHQIYILTAAFSPDGRTVATGHSDGSIWLWETATGSVRRRLEGHIGHVYSLAFSRDGLLLASSSGDGTGLVWDLSGRWRRGTLQPLALSGSECAELWRELGDAQEEKAYSAMWKLAAASRQSVALMRQRIPVVTAAQLTQWLAELDSDDFLVRERATRQLKAIGPTLQLAVQKVLTTNPVPEMRRRLKSLLETWRTAEGQAALRRALRGIEILEWTATPEGREILRKLADGPAESLLTKEAQSALRRTADKVMSSHPPRRPK